MNVPHADRYTSNGRTIVTEYQNPKDLMKRSVIVDAFIVIPMVCLVLTWYSAALQMVYNLLALSISWPIMEFGQALMVVLLMLFFKTESRGFLKYNELAYKQLFIKIFDKLYKPTWIIIIAWSYNAIWGV